MGLIDSIRNVFSNDEEQVTSADILNKVREKYPHLAEFDDARLSAALARKYPDKFGYLKTYAPDAPVPPALVPKSLRTESFYKAHPEEGTKEALKVIEQVKAKFPKYKNVDAQTMASALETKYPDVFPGLMAKLSPGKMQNSGGPESVVAGMFAPLPNLGPGQIEKPVSPPKIEQIPVLPKSTVQEPPQPTARPMVISLDSTKVSLPKGTPVQSFKNGNEAYLAAEKAGRPIIVEYPNRNGQVIRRILGTTNAETQVPDVKSSIVHAIAKKAEEIGGSFEKSTPEIIGRAVVETLKAPPDVLNLTQGQQLRSAKNLAAGGLSTVAGMIGAVPAMAQFIGADGKVSDGLEKAVGKLREMAAKVAPGDPTFGDKMVQGAASMAVFWVPGLGAAGAVGKMAELGAMASKIAKVTQIALPTVLEAATEQGGIYNDLVAKGLDKKEAAKRAFDGFWKNLVLLGVTNTISVGPESKKMLVNALRSAPSEGFQESAQDLISSTSKGEKVNWRNVIESGGIGAILGFAGGGAFGSHGGGESADGTGVRPGNPTPPLPTMSPEMRTYLDKVAEINRKDEEVPSPDFLKEDVFKVPTQKEANAAEEARFASAPGSVQRMAHSIRNEAVSQYNLDRNVFSQWKDLIGPGLQPPKIIAGQRDVMGEYNTLEVWMKKNDGRPIDVVAQDAVEMGLIKNPEDIFDALRRLKAPQNPSRNAVDYLDEALRINDYESSIEPQGPVDTGFDFPIEQPDFSAENPTLNAEHYTANLAKARIAGMPLREAVAFARKSSLSQGQKSAVEAFNRIITANKLTDSTFVQFVDSIKVDEDAFKKGYGAEFQADKYAIRGATFPIKNHPVVKSLVQFAVGAHAGTGYHEAFHTISSNVLTEQEYAVLKNKFGTEENMAEAFAKYEKLKTGREKSTRIKAIFDKIAAFLERLRSYFNGKGWRTAEDVFKGISEGKTARSTIEARTMDTAYQAAPLNAPIFYSQLQSVIEKKMPNSAPAEMVRSLISPASGNVKAEEVEWSGIEEFLKGKEKVSKQELLDYLKANEVQVKEVVKGEPLGHEIASLADQIHDERVDNEIERTIERGFDPDQIDRIDVSNSLDYEESVRQAEEKLNSNGPKFSSYQLPGGENYREVLLTLPGKIGQELPDGYKVIRGPDGSWGHEDQNGNRVDGWRTREDAIRALDRIPGSRVFRSSHFDEPNILAHVRMNDRTTADGKKVLFLEEIQSDWHQKGRSEGYLEEKPIPPHKVVPKKGAGGGFTVVDEAGNELTPNSRFVNAEEAEKEFSRFHRSSDFQNGVPNAPFKKTWHELALKRMLRYAVDNGYDGIAWTTGEQQAERYDLSKQLSEISYSGTNLKAFDKHGTEVISRTGVTPEELPDLIGKEAAHKLMEQKPKGTLRTLSGLDLKVGGEGMKGFYDQIIPAFLRKYVKKWGSTVMPVDIPSLLKSSQIESGARNAESFRDFLRWQTEGKKPTGKLSAPVLTVMMSRVSALLHDPQIGKAIVHLIPIDVMNDLIGGEFTPESVFKNPSVLADRFSVHPNSKITTAQQHAVISVMGAPTFPATEAFFGSIDPMGWPSDFRTTSETRDFHGITPSDIINSIKKYSKPQEVGLNLGVDITPAMRESLSQGQPMFQAERRPGLIDESVYDQNRKMQTPFSLSRQIGNAATSAKDQAELLLTPISSVLADINPMFRIAFRRQAYREGLARYEDTKAVLPFLQKARAMSPDDMADLDLALKNGDAPKISALVSAYGLDAEYKAARKTLDAIHARAKEVGYDVGYLEDYWPRVVKDQAGFLEAIKADKKWPDIEKLISMKQDELRRPLSEDEKVALVNSYLRGYQNGAIALARTPNMKTREVEVIGPGLNQHFRQFDDAIVRYISSMNHAIEARRFFGRGGKDLFVDELDQSIGHYVMDMRAKGLLKDARDEKRLRSILNAYFNQESMHGALAAYKDATVAMTIGNSIAALTQLQDLGTSVYRAPGHVIQSLGRALIGGSKITLEDLGLEQIAEELRDDRKSAVFVSKVLRAAGLAKLDKLTAETFINSVISKYQSQARAKTPGAEFLDRIRNLVGPDTGKAIEDLKSGEITDLVKFIAFSEILGVQPKAMTELPQAYLSGGNSRIFYALKTFQIRQLDFYRQEIFKKLAEPGFKNKVIGTRRLVALMSSLLLAGVGVDELKDFFLGRTTTWSDRIVDNILKMVGLSKWTLYKARQEGIASAAIKTILPPAPLIDQIWKDIRTAGDGKGLEVVQSIPLVGKFYYWWMGKGRFKKPLNDDMRWLKENAGALGLTRLRAYQFLNKTSTRSLLADTAEERKEARAKVAVYAKRLRVMAESRKEELLAKESRRKTRLMAR